MGNRDFLTNSEDSKKKANVAELPDLAELNKAPASEEDIKRKVQYIVNLTGHEESEVIVALYDCDYLVDKTVNALLEGDSQGEWVVIESRKSKKNHKQQQALAAAEAAAAIGEKKQEAVGAKKELRGGKRADVKSANARGRSQARSRDTAAFPAGQQQTVTRGGTNQQRPSQGGRQNATAWGKDRDRVDENFSRTDRGGRGRNMSGARGRGRGRYSANSSKRTTSMGRHGGYHSNVFTNEKVNVWQMGGASLFEDKTSKIGTWQNSIATAELEKEAAKAKESSKVQNETVSSASPAADGWPVDEWNNEADEEWTKGPKVFTASKAVRNDLHQGTLDSGAVVLQDMSMFQQVPPMESAKLATGNPCATFVPQPVNVVEQPLASGGNTSVFYTPPLAAPMGSSLVSSNDGDLYLGASTREEWNQLATDALKNELGIGKAKPLIKMSNVPDGMTKGIHENQKNLDELAYQREMVKGHHYITGQAKSKYQIESISNAHPAAMRDYQNRSHLAGQEFMGKGKMAADASSPMYVTANSKDQLSSVSINLHAAGSAHGMMGRGGNTMPSTYPVGGMTQSMGSNEMDVAMMSKGSGVGPPPVGDDKKDMHHGGAEGMAMRGSSNLNDTPSSVTTDASIRAQTNANTTALLNRGETPSNQMYNNSNNRTYTAACNVFGHRPAAMSAGGNPAVNPLAAPFQPPLPAAGISPYMGMYDQMNQLGFIPAPNLLFNNSYDLNSLNAMQQLASGQGNPRDTGAADYKPQINRGESMNSAAAAAAAVNLHQTMSNLSLAPAGHGAAAGMPAGAGHPFATPPNMVGGQQHSMMGFAPPYSHFSDRNRMGPRGIVETGVGGFQVPAVVSTCTSVSNSMNVQNKTGVPVYSGQAFNNSYEEMPATVHPERGNYSAGGSNQLKAAGTMNACSTGSHSTADVTSHRPYSSTLKMPYEPGKYGVGNASHVQPALAAAGAPYPAFPNAGYAGHPASYMPAPMMNSTIAAAMASNSQPIGMPGAAESASNPGQHSRYNANQASGRQASNMPPGNKVGYGYWSAN
ncbi:Protein lingerer [Trichinella pseudospiralis]|uniref:Protein lingerer n=1 Tax=Trichinella pseudospiralis TaxID=6337 RepID=A0A0V1J8G8_TRIPS|nr:Protein lingerer [Trichinella pseudospiralis]KRZ31282.1 Protein lingerer [Trichinella pseudospiralis]